jgi:tungstate transport system substrate-binding protein
MLKRLLPLTLLGLLPSFAMAESAILVQSTTSTANSGLYDHILPRFAEVSDIRVNVVAVGTGQAIRNAANCDGDVLLVHARAAEEAFVAEGRGIERTDLMYNDFVLVGPEADPAGLKGTRDAKAALAAIAKTRRCLRPVATTPGRIRKRRRSGTPPGLIRPVRREPGTAKPARAWGPR